MPPPPPTSSGQHRRELIERGFTIFPGVISPSLLRGLQTAVEERVHTMAHYVRPDGKKHTRHKGDHLHLVFNRKVLRSPMGGAGICHPLMTELVAHPGCMAALDDVGCEDKKFWSGYVLSKPPGGPPLYWHNDWSFWEDPVSAKAMPSQMFGMVYLCDTSRQNGCLRVQPRSHRRPSGVWQAVQENNHLQKLKRRGESNPASVMEADTANFNDPIFAAPGEDVPMRAGDLLLGDSRLLHGTHANDSDARRTCITLWYLSNFRGMSPRVRMGFANEWEGEAGRDILPGMNDGGVLDDLIPRGEPAWVGRQLPVRGGDRQRLARYPSAGAQDFLGANLPTGEYWVEPPPQAAARL